MKMKMFSVRKALHFHSPVTVAGCHPPEEHSQLSLCLEQGVGTPSHALPTPDSSLQFALKGPGKRTMFGVCYGHSLAILGGKLGLEKKSRSNHGPFGFCSQRDR